MDGGKVDVGHEDGFDAVLPGPLNYLVAVIVKFIKVDVRVCVNHLVGVLLTNVQTRSDYLVVLTIINKND